MTILELRLNLPDHLAQEAQKAGLLTSASIERLLREELRRHYIDQLFEAADRMANLDLPPLSAEEVEAEIAAARAEKRADLARRS